MLLSVARYIPVAPMSLMRRWAQVTWAARLRSNFSWPGDSSSGGGGSSSKGGRWYESGMRG